MSYGINFLSDQKGKPRHGMHLWQAPCSNYSIHRGITAWLNFFVLSFLHDFYIVSLLKKNSFWTVVPFLPAFTDTHVSFFIFQHTGCASLKHQNFRLVEKSWTLSSNNNNEQWLNRLVVIYLFILFFNSTPCIFTYLYATLHWVIFNALTFKSITLTIITSHLVGFAFLQSINDTTKTKANNTPGTSSE